MITWITLDDAEQRIAKFLARERHAGARAAGLVNQQVSDQPAADVELDGVAAEIAFAKLFNLYPDLSILGAACAGSHDCTIGPYRVDVKTTRREDGRLLAHRTKQLGAVDLYVLMIGTFPRYGFAGFARAGDLLDPSRFVDLGYGDTYALDQSQLTPDLPLVTDPPPF